MGLIRAVRGCYPRFGENCFVAENATVIGDVIMGDSCSIWYQAILRGDVHRIRLGDRCNVQDGAVIHCTYDYAYTIIGNDVSIGHRAIIHGCHIADAVLIGMGAIIMDKVIIEPEVIVAAGAVVTPGMKLESGYIYGGLPAKKLKAITAVQRQALCHGTATNYVKYSDWYRT